MSTATKTTHERQSALQLAALEWMHQNRKKYSGNRELCSEAVNFLIEAHEASQATAQNAAFAAFGEFLQDGCRHCLDISVSTKNLAAIRDPDSGLTYAIPVKTIVETLLQQPAKQPHRLHLVKTTVH